jgi:outer membrane protein assembly factor BamC
MMKREKKKFPQLLVMLPMMLSLSSCSVVDDLVDVKKSNLNYKSNDSVKALDFPPDLTAPEFDNAFVLPSNGTVSASAVVNQSGVYSTKDQKITVLPKSSTVRSGQLGVVRWLDVNGPAEKIWPLLRDFWRSIGIPLKKDEPQIGIMETEWAESQAGLPAGWLRGKLGAIFQSTYDAGSRDRYRIRVEKSTAKTTRIYLTHKGAEEVVDKAGSGWQLRPANHEKEAELLNRLKAFLQGDVAAATGKKSPASNMQTTSSSVNLVEQEGQTILQVYDTYNRTWALTGIMMGRMGLIVETQNQSEGIYKVKYQGNEEDTEKKGFFKRFFKDKVTILLKEEDYQVHIQDAGKISVVRIFDAEGSPLSKRQTRIALARLKKEFDR